MPVTLNIPVLIAQTKEYLGYCMVRYAGVQKLADKGGSEAGNLLCIIARLCAARRTIISSDCSRRDLELCKLP